MTLVPQHIRKIFPALYLLITTWREREKEDDRIEFFRLYSGCLISSNSVLKESGKLNEYTVEVRNLHTLKLVIKTHFSTTPQIFC